MHKFRVGDRVRKARPYTNREYCRFGGSSRSVPLGTCGKVERVHGVGSFCYPDVLFDNGVYWGVDFSELDLVSPKKTKVYGVAKFCLSLK